MGDDALIEAVVAAILGGDLLYPDGSVIMDSHRHEAREAATRALAAIRATPGWALVRTEGEEFEAACARMREAMGDDFWPPDEFDVRAALRAALNQTGETDA